MKRAYLCFFKKIEYLIKVVKKKKKKKKKRVHVLFLREEWLNKVFPSFPFLVYHFCIFVHPLAYQIFVSCHTFLSDSAFLLFFLRPLQNCTLDFEILCAYSRVLTQEIVTCGSQLENLDFEKYLHVTYFSIYKR